MTVKAFYHFVFGVDTSSSACVAAYLTEVMKYHPKATRAVFCIYDVVTKRDIRVEIQIPGGTQVYVITQVGCDEI